MVDVTNACHLHCSNCTRVLDHARKRYFMTVGQVEEAISALSTFPTESEPAQEGRRNMLGMIGGEPLLHPEFPKLVDVFVKHVPEVRFRGLWTGLDWATYTHPKYGAARSHVVRLVGNHGELLGEAGDPPQKRGWLNWNMHLKVMQVEHAPILVASKDAVPDPWTRWKLIENCWLQQKWSSTVTPRGFFFCEVAGHLDMIFNGQGSTQLPKLQGLPVEDAVWKGDLFFEDDVTGVRQPRGKFAEQVLGACENCGVCVPLQGRLDSEEIDDVSLSNLALLRNVASPRVRKGRYAVRTFDGFGADPKRQVGNPRVYVKGQKPANQSAVAAREKACR